MSAEPSVVGLPVLEEERYLTRRELADLMGVSLRTIDNMVAEGMPCERWGRRLLRFKPSTALQWARTQRSES